MKLGKVEWLKNKHLVIRGPPIAGSQYFHFEGTCSTFPLADVVKVITVRDFC